MKAGTLGCMMGQKDDAVLNSRSCHECFCPWLLRVAQHNQGSIKQGSFLLESFSIK